VQKSLCVQVLPSPIFAALLHGTPTGYWTTRGLVNSRTGQLADATGDFACLVFVLLAASARPRVVQSATCPVRELAIRELSSYPPGAGVSQTLRRGTRNGITELLQRAPPIFGWAAITLGIGPNSTICISLLANVNSRPRSLFAVARPSLQSSVCRLSVVCRSVVCNAGAPYSGGSNFRQYFYGVRYLGHPLTYIKNFTEIVPGEPLRRGSETQEGEPSIAI